MRTTMRLMVAAIAAAGIMLAPRAVKAHHEPLIQPGAAAYPGHTPLGPYTPCTLNFVFQDRRHVYIGTSARCTLTEGERVTMAGREFGTVVFRAFTGSEEADSFVSQAPIDDFALIRIDRSEAHRVSPVVLDVGRTPSGVKTSAQTTDGELLFMTGQAVGVSGTPARTRPGALLSDDARGFRMAVAAGPGDSGAPVLGEPFAAVGVLSAHSVTGAFGTTMERILVLLREAGFRVELVTSWEVRP